MSEYVNFNLYFKLPTNINITRTEAADLLAKMEELCNKKDFELMDSEFELFED